MKTKKRQPGFGYWIGVTLISAVAILMLGLVVRQWQPETTAEAGNAAELPPPSVQVTKTDNLTQNEVHNALPPETVSNVQVVNGIEVATSNPRLDGDRLTVDVCFTIPDDNPDWIISKISLTTGKTTIADWSATPIELWFPAINGQQQVITHDAKGNASIRIETVTGNQPGRRCDAFTFQVPAGATVSGAILSVNAITSQPAEGQYCARLTKVQEQLKTRNINFSFKCTEQDGVTNVTLVGKPASMNQAEAEQLIYSDEWFSKLGPWTFELAVGK